MCVCALQLMPNRQRPEAVAQQYISSRYDPPWIEEKYVNDIKGNPTQLLYTVSLIVLCDVVFNCSLFLQDA